jgi:hypothetical protein
VLVSQRILKKKFLFFKEYKKRTFTAQRMFDIFSWITVFCRSRVKLASTSYVIYKFHRQTGKHEIEIGNGRKTVKGHRKVGQELKESGFRKVKQERQESISRHAGRKRSGSSFRVKASAAASVDNILFDNCKDLPYVINLFMFSNPKKLIS